MTQETELNVREILETMRRVVESVDDGTSWDWYHATTDKPHEAKVYKLNTAHNITPFATVNGKDCDKLAGYVAIMNPRNVGMLLSMCSQLEEMVVKLSAERDEANIERTNLEAQLDNASQNQEEK